MSFWLNTVQDAWLEAVTQAWHLALGERRNELAGKYISRFDQRSLHPWSLVWGRIWACEELGEFTSDADPLRMKAEARVAADAEYREAVLATA